jgi:hypothetical protein
MAGSIGEGRRRNDPVLPRFNAHADTLARVHEVAHSGVPGVGVALLKDDYLSLRINASHCPGFGAFSPAASSMVNSSVVKVRPPSSSTSTFQGPVQEGAIFLLVQSRQPF